MASILDYLQGYPPQPAPIQNVDPFEEERINQSLGNPKTISGRIQEFLGAREPNQAGLAQGILSGRFQPTFDDSATGAVQTLMTGKPISGQNIADERMKNTVDQIAALSRAEYLSKGGGSGSVFAQTMEAINSDPELANLSVMDKIRLAQNKVGTNLTMNAQGQVRDMAGAATGLGNLAYGEEMGTQNARVQTAQPLAIEKGLGEAATAERIATNTAIGKAVGEAEGANAKKVVNAPQIMSLVQQAKSVLPYATSGGASAFGAKAKSFIGISDLNTQSDAQLDAISAGLLNNVPRMEGPQSDADRQSYEKAAGDIGNRAKPIGDRAAALRTIEALQQKYMSQPQISSNGPGFNLPVNGTGSYVNDAGVQTDQARQAPDGNWYLPDPNRPGKYLMVQP